jgi:hypothetical protein
MRTLRKSENALGLSQQRELGSHHASRSNNVVLERSNRVLEKLQKLINYSTYNTAYTSTIIFQTTEENFLETDKEDHDVERIFPSNEEWCFATRRNRHGT